MKFRKYTISKILTIDVNDLPTDVKNEVLASQEYLNGSKMTFYSDLYRDKSESISEWLTISRYSEFKKENPSKNLIIEKFLIDSQLPLYRIDYIQFYVSW